MARHTYRTTPSDSDTMPPGIPYIVANEAAERFSFYGMKTILVVFMTRYLMDAAGNRAPMSGGEASYYYHLFNSAVYFFPVVGAIIADAVLGKYRTIISLSIVYCLGHLALALDDTRLGLSIGLTLIAIGSGGIKPCVSAHVGDQFGSGNRHLMERVFSWFYFAINFGSFFSTLLIPFLLDRYSAQVAFGVPGALMLLASLVFWMGRYRFVHIPAGGRSFVRELTSREGLRSISGLFVLYLFVAVFWSLYDQTGSAWVLQAEKMDRSLFGICWLPSQIQAINPILIMLFIPIFTGIVYPLLGRLFPLTPLRKIGIGFFLTVPAFLIPAWVEHLVAGGARPGILWQIGAYVLLTMAEVMVSITCLDFSYTQAPRRMKSMVMSLFLLSVSIGNGMTALINYAITGPDGLRRIDGIGYFLLFAGIMLIASLLFVLVARGFVEQQRLQD